MIKRRIVLMFVVLVMAAHNTVIGQPVVSEIPTIIEHNGRHALLVDGKPFFILGGQCHNSSAWPATLPKVWAAIEKMHANTLEAPIYWEQVEPAPGKFNFSMIDTLLKQAEAHKVHLILLWFATWKNGSSHYMPEWMKREPGKYPNISGKNGRPVDSPSPNTRATLDADIHAFTAVMRYLKKTDTQRTVIMLQVENESGSWGSVRDYSAHAQKLFEGPVPAELLIPKILIALNVPETTRGSWKEVFGDRADEYFQAWSVARFVGQVAAAGKAEYPLPMYVNAALRDPLTNPPATNYESGGPTDNVIPIWKAAAPAIDLVAPDIYLVDSEKVLKVLDLYDRPDNTLFVPEAGLKPENAKYLYQVMAHGGVGFSPFGIDANGADGAFMETAEELDPFSQEYQIAAPMMRQLAEWSFEGKIKAVIEHEDHAEQTIDLGVWQAIVSFGTGKGGHAVQTNAQPLGKLMIVKLEENKFLVMGTLSHITFRPAGSNPGKAWQYLEVEEGRYVNGSFQRSRILNGDETDWGGPRFGTAPTVLQITVATR